MKNMKIIENENQTLVIEFGNFGLAKFYDKNRDYTLTKTISFKTIKVKPKSNITSITKEDGSSFMVQQRSDKEGHITRTSLKDILSFLDGNYEGEFTEQVKSKYNTEVRLLKK
jgi:hypothetical protein